MIELVYFDDRGNYDGRDRCEDHAITTDMMGCARDVMAAGGYVTVERDSNGIVKTWTLDELTDAFAAAKAIEPDRLADIEARSRATDDRLAKMGFFN